MDEPLATSILRELQSDLARKYTLHAARVENIWRSFNKSQRASCFVAGAADGVVLKTSSDKSLGNIYKIIPELNLRDITEKGPEFLLDLLRHRATNTLFEQYCHGVNGKPGDHSFIIESMRINGLRHVEPFHNCYTDFMDTEKYGRSFELVKNKAEMLRNLELAISAGLFVPQSTGELILQRQMYLIQSLNILIEDILDQGSTSRKRKESTAPSKKSASTDLPLHPPSAKLSLPDLTLNALDQKTTFEEYLDLLSMEPSVLTHAVNLEFFTRPELMVDERGRRLPLHTDKHISAALFETVRKANEVTAIWDYICRLLKLLESFPKDKVGRAVILQELSNVCHMEYVRAQAVFTRCIQSGTGSMCFHRLGGKLRVVMKHQPDALTLADPQLHYILRLCHVQTSSSEAINWLEKLGSLHQTHPLEREKLKEREIDTLYDLTCIIELTQNLHKALSIPSFSRKTAQTFITRLESLKVELTQLKDKIDLSEFAVPINHLLEPQMAHNALQAIGKLVIQTTGADMGSLYDKIVEECFDSLQRRYQQALNDASQEKELAPSLFTTILESKEKFATELKQKEKTRPSQSSAGEAVPQTVTPTVQESSPQQLHKVRPSTSKVFSSFFNKSDERSSVNWDDFQAAMTDVGFSVVPKYGSVYTFFPPDSMEVRRPLAIHRPHQSRIEGYQTLIIARRLKRLYSWNEKTFIVA